MRSVFLRVLLSNRLTTVLLLLFAMAMAFGTFLENDFGIQAVQTTVYRAWWFELIMFLLGVNFIGNIFKYRLYRKEKLAILTFHISFIIILIGAFITRYVSFEGIMHIREGSASNEIVSQDRFIQVRYQENGEEKTIEKKLVLSYFAQPDFNLRISDDLSIIGNVFVPQAEQRIVRDPGGNTVLTIVTSSSVGRTNLYLRSGGTVLANNTPITLNQPRDGAINIVEVDGLLKINSPQELSWMVMASQTAGSLRADTLANLQLRALYQGEGVSFVIPEVHYESKVVYMTSEDKEKAKRLDDMLFVDVVTSSGTQEIFLRAFDGNISKTEHLNINGEHLDITYGPKPITLPFSLELRDFQLERYPGSVSPSSYASEVTVVDGQERFPYRIYMNNVLDHRGYRFFQASYDTDELGTVLSVNKDYWGTLVTYIGYTLMGLGMMLTLFGKNSRFQFVNRQLSKLNKQAGTAIIALLALLSPIVGQSQDNFNYPDNVKTQVVSEDHALSFGNLLVQDLDGRIKPINTLSSEFLRKVHGRSSFKVDQSLSLNNDQLFLMVNANPLVWQDVPIIKIDAKKAQPVLELLDQPLDTEFLRFKDLIDASGNYLLQDQVLEATRKKPAERSSFDDELIKVDERFNVFFQGLTGHFLKIFPLENDPARTWFNGQISRGTFNQEDSIFVVNVLPVYFNSVLASGKSGDWSEADENLGYLRTFQDIKGQNVIPSKSILEAEILYNKLKLFNHLFGYFWVFGLLLLITAILRIFYSARPLVLTYWSLTTLVGIGFLALTFNLILRWYAAQYPPWSNGYEMIILVAWALLLFGFIFIKKSRFVVALGALFTGTLLFVAFLDWLNPEITNLVPVLKSYWLKIHVAIIVGSYAPLALSALLGLLALVLMISDKGHNQSLGRSIKELTYINEMSMTIGLFMLAIGTFLGGVWANESWGRYWGWDPKETWALISVIIYAAVVHLRLIPKLNDLYVFNVASVWAFFSIIMTSFGVNYYLAGLHSYAKGDPVPIPQFIYWVVAILFLVSLFANLSYRKRKLTTK